jgi:hypothetical protein
MARRELRSETKTSCVMLSDEIQRKFVCLNLNEPSYLKRFHNHGSDSVNHLVCLNLNEPSYLKKFRNRGLPTVSFQLPSFYLCCSRSTDVGPIVIV